jgi:hypothetical protein
VMVGQIQLALPTQAGFLQAPLLHTIPVKQFESNEQLLPHCGTGDGDGVGIGLGEGVGIGLGDGVIVGQIQLALLTQFGFLQKPLLQTCPVKQFALDVQLVPHWGTGDGVGVGTGDGDGVGTGLGEGVGVAKTKLKLQFNCVPFITVKFIVIGEPAVPVAPAAV